MNTPGQYTIDQIAKLVGLAPGWSLKAAQYNSQIDFGKGKEEFLEAIKKLQNEGYEGLPVVLKAGNINADGTIANNAPSQTFIIPPGESENETQYIELIPTTNKSSGQQQFYGFPAPSNHQQSQPQQSYAGMPDLQGLLTNQLSNIKSEFDSAIERNNTMWERRMLEEERRRNQQEIERKNEELAKREAELDEKEKELKDRQRKVLGNIGEVGTELLDMAAEKLRGKDSKKKDELKKEET
ncbi:MAG: hypothetical protein C0594_07990, partial [Marinilabiliales bacterium]